MDKGGEGVGVGRGVVAGGKEWLGGLRRELSDRHTAGRLCSCLS